MRVTVVRNVHGDFEVHKAGCRDLNNTRKFDPWERRQAGSEDLASRYEVAEAVYGEDSGSFFEEQDYYKTYEEFITACISDFIFAPCVRELR